MKSVALCAIAFLLLSFSCNTTDPPPPPQYVRSIELTPEDASCVETWLRVRITDGSAPPFDIRLHRDGDSVQTLRLSTPDSVLIDEGLLPNRTYTYMAYRLADSRLTDSTTLQTVTTMDTSSSNWVFDPPVLLGSGSSSVLYDCQIVRADPDSLLVLAVGEIYHSDSSQSFLPFSVASWNGQTWQLKRLYYNGTNIITAIRGIWVAGPNDIWLAAGSVFHWDGTSSQTQLSFSRLNLPDPNATIEKLWGSPELGLYGVGNAGTIVHRNTSGTWRRLESGTGLRIQDIVGVQNAVGGDQRIVAVAANKFTNDGVAVLEVRTNGVAHLPVSGLPTTSVVGVWSKNGLQYHVCGDGLYLSNNLGGSWREIAHGVPRIYMQGVRGTESNDILVVGDFGFLLRWNGATWREYSNNELPYFAGQYEEVDVTPHLMFAVGWLNDGRAIALSGRR